MFGKWALAAALVAVSLSTASGRGDHSFAGNFTGRHDLVLSIFAHAVGLCSSREGRAACDVPSQCCDVPRRDAPISFRTFCAAFMRLSLLKEQRAAKTFP